MGKRIWVLLSRPDECGNRSAIVVGAYATVEAAEAAIVDELGDAVERDADSLGVTLSDSDGVILGYLQAVEVDGEGELASLVRPAPDPAAIDATDETRLAAGWRQQVVCGDDVEPSASTAAPPRVHDPAGCAVMSAGQLCLRCCKPMATAADHDEYEAHVDADHPPNGWTDREGSHLCWRGVGGQCLPFGDSLRITSGHLVLHDGSTLLSVPLEQVRVLLAGVP